VIRTKAFFTNTKSIVKKISSLFVLALISAHEIFTTRQFTARQSQIADNANIVFVTTCYSLNYQHHLSSTFTLLASNSVILNWLLFSAVLSTTLDNPQYLLSLLHPYTPSRQLRSASLKLLSQPRINIALASRGFRQAGSSLWNSLSHHLRSIDSYIVLKSNLKTHIFSGASISGP